MIKKKNNFILIFILLISIKLVASTPHDTLSKKDSIQFLDDPIAANLDSLSNLSFFENGYDFVKSPNYNFSKDSIPWYSDKVFADRLSKLDDQTPFDLQYNDVVKQYIELYAVKKRELTSRALALSKLYFPMIEQTLDHYNMPLELKYLAVVESAMNPAACSSAGARGLWQFMYSTGKLYNLKVSSYIDERNDPIKSTVAACEYLKYLHGIFNNWELALAAYNCGPFGVIKAIRRSGGKTNFWQIRPFLPKETQGYVPAFIAINYVMNYATSHNIYPVITNPTFFDVDTVCVHEQISFSQLSTYLSMSYDEISYLNPCYKIGVIPYSSAGCYTLCLPIPKAGIFIENEKAIYDLSNKELSSQQILDLQHRIPKMIYHKVRTGENITTIARKYRCTTNQLKEWNGLSSNHVYPGQYLVVCKKK